MPFVEGTCGVGGDVHRFEPEVGGPLAPFGGDDHPTACNGIFAKLWHACPAQCTYLCIGIESVRIHFDARGPVRDVDHHDIEAAGSSYRR